MPGTGDIVLIALAAATAAFLLWSKLSPGARQARRMTQAFVPNPDNTTSVSVRGWSRSDLERILTDFREGYELRIAMPVAEEADGALVIRFPDDIEPTKLYFLVNYICYPKDFDMEGRHVVVAGHAVLNKAFGIPDPALAGRRAVIYVPTGDTDYDLVYVRPESGKAYRVSFTNLIWKAAAEARQPSGIGDLQRRPS
jgi:hypothetical protein